MKTLAVLFFLLFAAFLITPSAVTLIKQNADVSMVFNYSEEEEHNSGSSDENTVKENQCKLFSEKGQYFVFTTLNKKSFQTHYNRSTLKIYYELLSPPPEVA